MNGAAGGLTDAQREAVDHPGRRIALIGGPGTGKTTTLVARFGRLAARGTAPDGVLTIAHSAAAADRLRARLEAALERPYEELSTFTVTELAARLLRDDALAAGLDPFAVPVAAADRLALLLDHADDLPLRRHDLQGNPSALLASVLERIDRLKDEMVSAEDHAAQVAGLEGERGEREREFVAIYEAHDELLAEAGVLDYGEVVLRAHRLLSEQAGVRDQAAARFPHLLVDDYQELTTAQRALLDVLAGGEGGESFLAATHDTAAAGAFGGDTVALRRNHRCGRPVLAAAGAVLGEDEDAEPTGEGGEVAFWRCANERAQAQAVAAEAEALLRGGTPPEAIAVLVRSVRREGRPVAVALEERAVPHRLVGATAFFERAEVRDLLAWLRLLADPGDAPAVVRALARPPVELRSIDLARVTQIARRRKLDMVSALAAATESPQIPPEARDRILVFLKLHRSAAAALDTTRPDLFVHRLVDRLGLRRQQLFAAQADVVERLVNLAKFSELASSYVRRSPQATPREFARYIAAVAEAGLPEEEAGSDSPVGAVQVMSMSGARGLEFEHVFVIGLSSAQGDEMRPLVRDAITRARGKAVLAYPDQHEGGSTRPPAAMLEDARTALEGEFEERVEELFGPAESLHSTFRILRDELLDTVAQTAGRLSELRFDTDLDVSHAVVRYLELIKLAALIERPEDQEVADALPEINARLLRSATSEQREIYDTSALDDYLLETERGERRRAAALSARDEPSLEAFLPTRGDGLLLSASDVETYRICPLRYKFARVFRIPQEPTVNQRFGILVHQVLERFHAGGGTQTQSELLGLLEAGWRRSGFADSDEERQLRTKAEAALTRYHERFQTDEAQPVWFERAFNFRLGPHTLRGRVDRVDRLPDGGYELIDYKTGRPKTAAQLKDDVQLSLYAVGAREAWDLEASSQAYYYVLDDSKVPVTHDAGDTDWITDTVMEVGEGILSQGFEPTPSYAACSTCDFRLICPAAEK